MSCKVTFTYHSIILKTKPAPGLRGRSTYIQVCELDTDDWSVKRQRIIDAATDMCKWHKDNNNTDQCKPLPVQISDELIDLAIIQHFLGTCARLKHSFELQVKFASDQESIESRPLRTWWRSLCNYLLKRAGGFVWHLSLLMPHKHGKNNFIQDAVNICTYVKPFTNCQFKRLKINAPKNWFGINYELRPQFRKDFCKAVQAFKHIALHTKYPHHYEFCHLIISALLSSHIQRVHLQLSFPNKRLEDALLAIQTSIAPARETQIKVLTIKTSKHTYNFVPETFHTIADPTLGQSLLDTCQSLV